MKNTRKALSILGAVIVLSLLIAVLVPVSTVAAAGVTSRIRTTDKRAEYQQFRQFLEAHRQVILQNREQNAVLVRENKDLRLALKGRLTTAKADLDQATIDQLKTIRDQIKVLMDELQATKGDIRDITQGNRQLIRDLNYEALAGSFAQIIGIQQMRSVKLSAINLLIEQMSALVR